MSSAASDLPLLEAAAREAGAIARDAFGKEIDVRWKESDHAEDSPVTDVDLAMDALLTERLRSARPEYGWLSEETTDSEERLSKRRVFIVDPLDGTRAFLAKLPEFCVSLAVVEDGRAVLGCIYNPVLDEMYVGGTETPATCNGAPLKTTARTQLEHARLIGRKAFYDDARWPQPWPPLDFFWRNSIAYRMSLIAAGQADGAVMFGFKNEWDTAGGTAILEAAGGCVTDMFGAPLQFNQPEPHAPGCVASCGPLHPLLIARVKHLPHPREWAKGRTTPPKETKPT